MPSTLPFGIEEFLLVAEHQSFTGAAQSLGLSRARISQVIRQLEQTLGIQLFHRSTRVISLTSAGEVFYQQCRTGIDQLYFAVENAQDMHSNLSGVIRINSVGGLFGEQILAPVLAQFMKRHPEVQIELDFSSVREDVIEAKFDLVVRMGTLSDSSLIGRPLTHYQNYLVASPDYLLNTEPLNHPRDLQHHALINGSIKKWTLQHHENREKPYEVTVQAKVQCSNGHVAHSFALAGLGITRQPSYYVEQALSNGQLVQVLADWSLGQTTASLVYPKARHPSARVKALIEFLTSAFANAPQGQINSLHSRTQASSKP